MISFTVPLAPPSVNHYVKHTRDGRHYLTAEAHAFKQAMAVFAAGKTAIPSALTKNTRYRVRFCVYLGKGQRLDIDNSQKCVFDGLKDAGVIHSDAAVWDIGVSMGRDWDNPRTQILEVSSYELREVKRK